MWEFYLAGSEVAFRHQDHIVSRCRSPRRVDTVPLTRDYMFDWERAHAPKRERSPRGRIAPLCTAGEAGGALRSQRR